MQKKEKDNDKGYGLTAYLIATSVLLLPVVILLPVVFDMQDNYERNNQIRDEAEVKTSEVEGKSFGNDPQLELSNNDVIPYDNRLTVNIGDTVHYKQYREEMLIIVPLIENRESDKLSTEIVKVE